jgi:hypothetical protein
MEHLGRLVAAGSSTPLATLFGVLVGAEKKRLDQIKGEVEGITQVSLGAADNSGEVTLVFVLDFLDNDNSRSLLVGYSTETGLALDDDVGNTHLAAESRNEDGEFDGIDIMGDDDESSLLGLDEGNNVVQAILHEQGLLGVLHRPLSEIIHNENGGTYHTLASFSLSSAATATAAKRRAFLSCLDSGSTC